MLITDSAYEAGLARLRAAAATEQGPVIDTLDLLVLRADRATTTASPPAKPGSGQSAELLFRRNLDVNLETGGRQHPARKPLPGSVGITSSLALQRPVGDGRIRTRRPPAPKGIYGRARAEPPPYLDRGGPGER
jgi:hypothetical protein